MAMTNKDLSKIQAANAKKNVMFNVMKDAYNKPKYQKQGQVNTKKPEPVYKGNPAHHTKLTWAGKSHHYPKGGVEQFKDFNQKLDSGQLVKKIRSDGSVTYTQRMRMGGSCGKVIKGSSLR